MSPTDPTAEDPFVRPFMLTGGRTTGRDTDLPVEAMVIATSAGVPAEPDHAAVVRLCTAPLSIAEIGAHLDLPVGVARVLAADLTASGHLNRCETAVTGDAQLVRRILDGIRTL